MYLSIVGLASLFFLSLSQLCSFGGKLASACFIFIYYEWKASLNVIWFEHQTIAFPWALERRMSKVFFSPLLPQWTILICKVIIESERCQQYRNIYIYIHASLDKQLLFNFIFQNFMGGGRGEKKLQFLFLVTTTGCSKAMPTNCTFDVTWQCMIFFHYALAEQV